MARKLLIRTSSGCYHVMARVNHRDKFPIPLADCWSIFMGLLPHVSAKFGAKVHSFVLMPNHYHMLLSTPLLNIDKVMKVFNQEATRAMSKKTGLINHIFGARYRWSIAYRPQDIAHVMKYILRNPVKAGLSKSVENYPYSSIESFLNPKSYQSTHFSPVESLQNLLPWHSRKLIFEWLNTALPKEKEDLLRKAMRRKEFKYSNYHSHRKLVSDLSVFSLD